MPLDVTDMVAAIVHAAPITAEPRYVLLSTLITNASIAALTPILAICSAVLLMFPSDLPLYSPVM